MVVLGTNTFEDFDSIDLFNSSCGWDVLLINFDFGYFKIDFGVSALESADQTLLSSSLNSSELEEALLKIVDGNDTLPIFLEESPKLTSSYLTGLKSLISFRTYIFLPLKNNCISDHSSFRIICFSLIEFS